MLTWKFDKHHAVFSSVCDINSVEHVCHLCSYLAQILNETLRLATVGPFAARVQDTDSVIAGHHIPAGVCLCYCQLHTSYRSKLISGGIFMSGFSSPKSADTSQSAIV